MNSLVSQVGHGIFPARKYGRFLAIDIFKKSPHFTYSTRQFSAFVGPLYVPWVNHRPPFHLCFFNFAIRETCHKEKNYFQLSSLRALWIVFFSLFEIDRCAGVSCHSYQCIILDEYSSYSINLYKYPVCFC